MNNCENQNVAAIVPSKSRVRFINKEHLRAGGPFVLDPARLRPSYATAAFPLSTASKAWRHVNVENATSVKM